MALAQYISLSSHCLDTATGIPAANLRVTVEGLIDLPNADDFTCANFIVLAHGTTNNDGRVTADKWQAPSTTTLQAAEQKSFKIFRVTFHTREYFAKQQQQQNIFYPVAQVTFEKIDNKHFHIPLLLSPFGFSTYRGS